jgi:hypothetical protein
MASRRSSAPVQTDPIRQRLGIAAAVRDVSCPNCGVVFATAVRWQMRCPECEHRWTDRSSRTFLDSVRDVRLEVFVTMIMVTAVICSVAGFALIVGWLIAEAAGIHGWDRTSGLAALFVAALVSIVVLGKLFRQ